MGAEVKMANSALHCTSYERGIIPQRGQCYAFAPHPALLGRIDVERVLSILVNQSGAVTVSRW